MFCNQTSVRPFNEANQSKKDTHDEVNQAIEHEHIPVPRRLLQLPRIGYTDRHRHGGVDHEVQDITESIADFVVGFVSQERRLVNGHDFTQHL